MRHAVVNVAPKASDDAVLLYGLGGLAGVAACGLHAAVIACQSAECGFRDVLCDTLHVAGLITAAGSTGLHDEYSV